jgi:hypothetical protein
MSIPSSEGPVLVAARDLFFRGKLEGLVRAAGREVVREAPAAVAVVELGSAAAVERVRELVAGGARVIAFGSHVDPQALRQAREAGAEAVPNSQVEATLRGLLENEGDRGSGLGA